VTNHLNEVLPRHRRDELMALVNVRPTKPDVLIARTVARNTNHSAEVISRGLTWGADEKILLLLATAGWVATRGRSQQLQRAGNHAHGTLERSAEKTFCHVCAARFWRSAPSPLRST